MYDKAQILLKELVDGDGKKKYTKTMRRVSVANLLQPPRSASNNEYILFNFVIIISNIVLMVMM